MAARREFEMQLLAAKRGRYSTRMSHGSAVSMLILVSILWSLGGVLIKSVDWHPLAIAGTRSAIAALMLWAWIRRPQFTWSATQLGAAAAYVATVSLFVVANQLTTAANAIFLQYTAPIYVAIVGPVILGERVARSDWFCVGLALVGIAFFFRDQFSVTGGWGIAAALASGLSFATMVICLRKEGGASPLSALLLGNLATAVIGLPFGLTRPPGEGDWAPLITLGVVQMGLPYLLYGIAIKRVTALEATFIPMLEPVLNPIWVALVQKEMPGFWSMIGATLVLVAVAFRGLVRQTR
jgi:drug/metabolite transporter (DMT)-like permease